MAHPARPRHLGDVHEAFHAGLQLHEGAVVGEAHDAPLDLAADRVALVHVGPRVGGLLLVAEGDPAGHGVEVQHHDLHLVADLEDLRGMPDAAPRHVRHVEQPVDAAQVDEGAVIGDVLDRARQHHALGQDGERVLLLLLPLFLQHGAPRKDHVAAPPIELDHLRPDALAHQRPEVLDRAQIHLGSGQEGPDAHVHGQPSLHHLHHAPLHGRPAVVRCGDGVPDLDLVRLVLGEDDQPFVVLLGLEVDLDVVAHLGQRPVTKLLDGDGALALVADVDEDLAVAHLDDVAAHHLAFLDVAHATGKPVRHALLGGLIHLPVSAREGLRLLVRRFHNLPLPPLMSITGADGSPAPGPLPVRTRSFQTTPVGPAAGRWLASSPWSPRGIAPCAPPPPRP